MPGPVVVTVMDKDAMADYQAMAKDLRDAGIPAEVFLGNPKQFGKQLAYADRRASPVAIIQGSDERAAGEVQVKDLILGAEAAEEIEDNREWREGPRRAGDRAARPAGGDGARHPSTGTASSIRPARHEHRPGQRAPL